MTPVPDDRVKRLFVLKSLLKHAMAESQDLGMSIATKLIGAANLGVSEELEAQELPPDEI
jgi:hypothetical protein